VVFCSLADDAPKEMYKIKIEKENPNKNTLSNLTLLMIKLIWETCSQFQLALQNGAIF